MHDIRLIRDDPEAFDAAMARRGLLGEAGEILTMDAQRRETETIYQEALAAQNRRAKAIGAAKAAKNEALFQELLAEAERTKRMPGDSAEAAAQRSSELHDKLASLPNRPADEVPAGMDETGNVEQKAWGTKRQFNYAPANHAEIGPALGLDFETGARLSGARFTFLRGQMARLQRALGQFMLDRQAAVGFVECAPPLLVRGEAMFGTGQLPKFAEDSFRTSFSRDTADFEDALRARSENPNFQSQRSVEVTEQSRTKFLETVSRLDDRWLIPTSEVSLTNSVREQILADAALPIKMTALTPCFRSEAGSAGKDTRGYIRQHQFEKVELVTICRPDDSAAEHENMTLAAEAILQALDLPYRRMLLCAGDMGFSARKTYDLEVWLPGQDAYREISSISDCGDFQARRMNARYRPEGQKGTQFVHTLNGSGLAVGRTLVAVLENYQQEDGSVHVPEVLLPYMGGVTRLTPN